MRVSVAAEKAGIPAVSIVATPFLPIGRAVAKGLGIEKPVIAVYPGVPMLDSEEQLRDHVVNELLPQIIEGLRRRPETDPGAKRVSEPGMRDVLFKGTLAQVHRFFYENLWTDGLPIIPPTIPAVEEFLKFTDRAPEEVIGVCLPEYREATVWNVAVNGVMAGCRPEYMPVLIAVIEAVTDPVFFLEDAGATPGWEPLIILSGPIVKDLDFNYGGGVMRVGRQANTSIGRFLRLFIRNVPGQRIPPGVTDKASIGMTFNCVLPENEDAVADVGWEPFSVDRGYARGDNVVTVQSCASITPAAYTGGRDARNHMQILAEVIGQACSYWCYTGIRNQKWFPLLVLGPAVAKVFSDDGWKKDDIRKYLYDNVKMPAGLIEKYGRNTALSTFSLKDLVERGKIPPEYHESDDPNRLVRVFFKQEWINIVVSGDPGRNQSRGYVQSHRHGVPVSKRIALPGNWRQRLKQ